MFLKKLELHGFKSFAKKTTLDFPKGITVIAGPNGSGKSNIVDAVRWALAEQSVKNLRGKKGEDLIFYGSGSRHALVQASVAMAFDMDEDTKGNPSFPKGYPLLEFSEAVLERVVAKGGENNYLLNGRRVRLSDFEEFLAKSRIGDSSFRVLSQGLSDKLLNLSPREFRGFVEEAAGVKEYQDKKYQARQRLKSTQDNLARVSAIVAELSPQLKNLKREKEKLLKKEAYLAELKDLSQNLFGSRYQVILTQEKKLSEKSRALKQQLNPLAAEVKKLRENLFSFDQKTELHSEIAKLLAEIRQIEQEDNKLAREIIHEEGKISLDSEREKQRLPVDIDYLKEKIGGLVSQVKVDFKGMDPESLRNLLAKVLHGLQDLLNTINTGVATAADPNVLTSLQHNLHKLLTQQAELRKKMDGLVLTRNEKERYLTDERKTTLAAEKKYREKESELAGLENLFRQSDLEEEKLKLHREKFHNDLGLVGVITLADILTQSEQLSEKPTTVLAVAAESGLESLESKIFKLKHKLDEIGLIDASVVKEYDAVNERFEFLSKESADLTATVISLEQMARDLDKQVDQRYKNTLAEMSHVFGGYFRLIFGGGKAALAEMKTTVASYSAKASQDKSNTIIEDEDIEESRGIEIKLELPNKKIKGLNTLSGGERTLTSIALLFALASIRKPPVMVLDEIDAALDEANTQKFMRLLKELARQTQFIIITHNRETMRHADALYGVSMKDGISHLLSLKLQSA